MKEKTRYVGIRFTETAIERIIQKALKKSGKTYDIQNAIRIMCEETVTQAGAPVGNKNRAKGKTVEVKTQALEPNGGSNGGCEC